MEQQKKVTSPLGVIGAIGGQPDAFEMAFGGHLATPWTFFSVPIYYIGSTLVMMVSLLSTNLS